MVAEAPLSLVALRCRTSDRTGALVRGVDELAPLLGERLGLEPRQIGSPGRPRAGGWEADLREARGCLLEAGGQVDDALEAGRLPVLCADDCTVALTTLPTIARRRPDARFLWLDAHADFNTPATTRSGYLAGMALAGACGLWDAGFGDAIPAERVVLTGARDVEAGEREVLERSPVAAIGTSLEALVATQNALDRAPVYVHLDLDVLDPEDFPVEFPAPGGLRLDKLYDLFEAITAECELVGLEITAFYAPEDRVERRRAARSALAAVEPLLQAAEEGAHVRN